ncbi:MAG: hypothetical protein KJ995_07195 [Candidatus Omnitrophica bacterium]|nr:hypothetical protein [Candidatus Omnitrophota bacterium]MBU1128618.1 hypothetical protein [Candidatus Omnitrophota bacterium]MBU1784366.1 hypothetical protein [Candidatus Omnitrophota bacterium]MBU1852169.1 hypothetical protein [Candidatus Omnitrophota bacterium]
MAKKSDLNKVMEKYGPIMKKFGNEIGEAAKKGEESLVMMSKVLKIQMDILGGTLQKERIYHEIGKEVAAKLFKGGLDIPGMDKYKTRLDRIQSEEKKKKKAISQVRSAGKKTKKK